MNTWLSRSGKGKVEPASISEPVKITAGENEKRLSQRASKGIRNLIGPSEGIRIEKQKTEYSKFPSPAPSAFSFQHSAHSNETQFGLVFDSCFT